MIRREISIINRLGLHARAASKLVALTGSYQARITLGRDGQRPADGRSIMNLLMLAAPRGTPLVLECEGEDELALADAVCALFAARFDEED